MKIIAYSSKKEKVVLTANCLRGTLILCCGLTFVAFVSGTNSTFGRVTIDTKLK